MEMTRKERWIRTIRGEEVDRLIFWPKIFDNSYMRNQREPFSKMTIHEIHDYASTDIMRVISQYISWQYGSCEMKTEFEKDLCIKTYMTPHGELKSIQKFDASSDSYHPVQAPIQTREDILLMTEYFTSIEPSVNQEKLADFREQYKQFGDRGLVVDRVAESPFMDFVEWLAGIENAHYLLADYPDEVEELLDAMQKINVKLTKLKIESTPADMLYFTENTSTTVISPGQFRKYCKPYLTEYANLCNEAGKTLIYHMCGHLKLLLPELEGIPFQGIEALTTPPVGDTTFEDAKKVFKKKALIGGSNCMTWVKPQAEIIQELEESLSELKDYRGIVIGTGGVIPPGCTPETLRDVNLYLQSLPMKY